MPANISREEFDAANKQLYLEGKPNDGYLAYAELLNRRLFGPRPPGDDVLAERERCAKVVEGQWGIVLARKLGNEFTNALLLDTAGKIRSGDAI